MEMGDVGRIVCAKTGLRVDIEFNQTSMFASKDRLNSLTGTIKRTATGEELFSLAGHWDKVVHITPTGRPKEKEVFLDVAAEPVR